MRTIKFRGKDIISGELVYGDLIHGVGSKAGKCFILPLQVNLAYVKNCDPLDGVEVDPETVEQFTGLYDKNGKDIYEVDIIEEGLVYFDDEYLGFFVKGDFVEGEHKPLYDIPLPKILGNKYDNPELLKN